ncbi:MAG TPA: hypothetical protein VGO21_04000 [Candidatus Paceibacterota bacterium]|nr:hypothetical protein [Candidatus Paceibacterota bacterium]
MKKIFLIPALIIIAAGVVVVASGQFGKKGNTVSTNPPNNQVACTMEAKLCPNGSYVGRSGPKCEFAQCPTVPIQNKSGITGTVTLGPTCLVERVPPDPNCAPQPYSTSIKIFKSDGATVVKTIQTDPKGTFSVELAPGSYLLQPQGGKAFPRCGEASVEVKSGQYAKTEISCDTGIR